MERRPQAEEYCEGALSAAGRQLAFGSMPREPFVGFQMQLGGHGANWTATRLEVGASERMLWRKATGKKRRERYFFTMTSRSCSRVRKNFTESKRWNSLSRLLLLNS